VKGHRGTISADSAGLDGGSVFTVTLPGVVEGATEEEGAAWPSS
jgi:hypothetical protein